MMCRLALQNDCDAQRLELSRSVVNSLQAYMRVAIVLMGMTCVGDMSWLTSANIPCHKLCYWL